MTRDHVYDKGSRKRMDDGTPGFDFFRLSFGSLKDNMCVYTRS